METIKPILHTIWQACLLTFEQLYGYFGGMFLFGLILYLGARFTRNTFAKAFGPRAELFLTAWIGTPVHETGHALFCILFGHHITKMSLFKPNSKDGSIGFVEHTYNPKNIYHQSGNFFIGAGPMFTGSLAILALMWFLMPDGRELIGQLGNSKMLLPDLKNPDMAYFSQLRAVAKGVLVSLAKTEYLSSWQFWLFLYLSMAISAHMELSPPDIAGMLRGLLMITILFLLVNLVYVVFFHDHRSFIYLGIPFFSNLNWLFFFALIISLSIFLSAWIIGSFIILMRDHTLLNPFTR